MGDKGGGGAIGDNWDNGWQRGIIDQHPQSCKMDEPLTRWLPLRRSTGGLMVPVPHWLLNNALHAKAQWQ